MPVPDSTHGQDSNTPFPVPPPLPPLPVEPLEYSAEATDVGPLAKRVISRAAIVLGLIQAVTITSPLLRFGAAGFMSSMPAFILVVRLAVSIAMVAGGALVLSDPNGMAGRRVLGYAAWTSLACLAYLLVSAFGFELSRLPSNRPLWNNTIMLMNQAYSCLNSAVLPTMILVLMRGNRGHE